MDRQPASVEAKQNLEKELWFELDIDEDRDEPLLKGLVILLTLAVIGFFVRKHYRSKHRHHRVATAELPGGGPNSPRARPIDMEPGFGGDHMQMMPPEYAAAAAAAGGCWDASAMGQMQMQMQHGMHMGQQMPMGSMPPHLWPGQYPHHATQPPQPPSPLARSTNRWSFGSLDVFAKTADSLAL